MSSNLQPSVCGSESQVIQHVVSGRTQVLGVFGHPVEHSVSPCMHNAAAAALGLDWVYVPFPVRPEALCRALKALPALGIRGVNLTIPHKLAAVDAMDCLAPSAAALGAVNTVRVTDGLLEGHNTDPAGFMAPLVAAGFSAAGASAVVLGAGGAARSVAWALASAGASVIVANRTVERAASLAADINAAVAMPVVSSMGVSDESALRAAVAGASLLVNTTPAGMYPNVTGLPPAPLSALHAGLLVYDLVYRPRRTRLLAAAEAAGCAVLDGLPMLAHQGAESFRIWTDVAPPVGVMLSAAESFLQAAG